MKNKTWRSMTAVAVLLPALIGPDVAGELRPDRWRWSNPLPHGNNILDMYASEKLLVQVGDSGTLYMDYGDGQWVTVDTGVDYYLRGTTMMGSRLLAVGESGGIIWSDDLENFQPAVLQSTADWFEGVAATSQKAVAVGDYGAICLSADGQNWTQVTSGTSQWLRGVAFGNQAFIAVGENGTILRSSGGSSWSPVPSGTTKHLNRVRYLGTAGTGSFYAVGNNGVVLTSSTGTSWTPVPTGSTNDLYDISLNNSGILAAGDGALLQKSTGSTDWINQVTDLASNAPPDWLYICSQSRGDTWLAAGRTGLLVEGRSGTNTITEWQYAPSYSSHAWLWDVTMQDGIYIAVGDLAHITTSLDGILWTREVVPESQTNAIWLGVGGNSNLALAVGSNGQVVMSRADLKEITATNLVDGVPVATNILVNSLGIGWEPVPSYTDRTLQGVDASDQLFITTGAEGKLFTSPTGTNWTEQTTPTTSFLSSVAIGDGTCVAAGAAGTLLLGNHTGTDWTNIESGITTWIYRVRWLNGHYIAVGENGLILTSPDGSSWTSRNSGTDRWLTDIHYAEGLWMVTGYQGTLLSSPDLASWTKHPLPTGKSLYGAATLNGQLITVGAEGIILRNRINPVETPVQILGYSPNTVVEAGTTNFYELYLFGGEADQIFEFQYSTNLNSTWETEQKIELYDRSGTLYLIQTRNTTNMPPAEFSRTKLIL